MLTKLRHNPDQLVDSVFPGRYLPVIFLWILLYFLTQSATSATAKFFDTATLVTLMMASVIGTIWTRPVGNFDISGQLFIFVPFGFRNIISGLARIPIRDCSRCHVDTFID